MKKLLVAALAASGAGCATLTEDAMTPIALSFSDGSNGKCNLQNKRGAWPTSLPATVSVRKSVGSIPSEMGAKIIASTPPAS